MIRRIKILAGIAVGVIVFAVGLRLLGPRLYSGKLVVYPDNTIPEDFWSLSPERASMRLLQANRRSMHLESHRLSCEASKRVRLPDEWYMSYEDDFGDFFLKQSSAGCQLYYVGENEDQVPRKCGPVHDFRILDIDSKIGNHLARVMLSLPRHQATMIPKQSWVLRWQFPFLHQVSKPRIAVESPGDGFCHTLISRADGIPLLDISSSSVSGRVSEAWHDAIDDTVLASLYFMLMRIALPAKLGSRWSQLGLSLMKLSPEDRDKVPKYTQFEKDRLRGNVGKMLSLWLAHDSEVPLAFVEMSAEAASDSSFVTHLPLFREVHAKLGSSSRASGPEGKTLNWTRELVERTIERLEKVQSCGFDSRTVKIGNQQ